MWYLYLCGSVGKCIYVEVFMWQVLKAVKIKQFQRIFSLGFSQGEKKI